VLLIISYLSSNIINLIDLVALRLPFTTTLDFIITLTFISILTITYILRFIDLDRVI